MICGLPAEPCTRVGQIFFSMHDQTQDPQVIGRNLQVLGLVYSFFLTLFLGEENLHPEADKGPLQGTRNYTKQACKPFCRTSGDHQEYTEW